MMGDVDALIEIASICERKIDDGLDALDALEEIKGVLYEAGCFGDRIGSDKGGEFEPRAVAYQWHAGGGSALYSYASTGEILYPEALLAEIDSDIAYVTENIGIGKVLQQDFDELALLRQHIQEQINEGGKS